MSDKVTTLPLAELVEDTSIYPRHTVDDAHVMQLALALEAGCELPPLLVDAASKAIVDGFHRGRAWKRVHGPQAAVPVVLRTYASRADMIRDAVAMNSSHGRRLDAIDQTRAANMLKKSGFEVAQISLIMHVPEARVRKLEVRLAKAGVATPTTVPGTKQITLKRSVAHLQGTQLTDEQAEAHGLMPGTSFLLIARQLTVGLKTKMVNLEDGPLVTQLKELARALRESLRDL
jgi:hypothetical protein